jgi:hypothetical protein
MTSEPNSSPRPIYGAAQNLRANEGTIMPSHLKRSVRARMATTGETYQQALRKLRARLIAPKVEVQIWKRRRITA